MNRIKKGIFFALVVIGLGVSIFSCADNKLVPDPEVSYFDTFDLWVKKNYPHLQKVADTEGFYMSITKNTDGNTKKPTDSCYVSIEFSASLPNGAYFLNTDPVFARQLGSFSFNTHYVPFKFRVAEWGRYYGLTKAQYEALKQMSVGDEVEIVAAPNYGYDYSLDNMYEGFGGNAKIAKESMAHIKMKLVSFVLDAEKQAEEDVQKYLKDRSEAGEIWHETERGVFYNKILINDNEADSVRVDSALKINYTGYFMDQFVFDTSIKEVAEDNNIYDSNRKYVPSDFYYNKGDTTNFGGSGETGNYIKSFKGVIEKMRLGEKVIMICYPSKAYGAEGKYSLRGPLIQTHTPLIFDIEIIKKEEEEEK